MNHPCLRVAALLTLAGAAASCGGAAAYEAKAPGAESAADMDAALTTPESALAMLDHAEADLNRLLPRQPPQPGQAQAGYAQPAASAAPVAPLPPPPPPSPTAPEPALQQAEKSKPTSPSPAASPAAAPPRDKRAESERPRSVSADPCVTACSALASMERAADHLCGLAGASDGRCTSARDRVKHASARVQAACPACSG